MPGKWVSFCDLLISSVFVEILVMNQQIRHLIFPLTASLLGNLFLLSCGKMGPEFLAEPPKQLAAVRLSNDEASVGSKHVDRSYLVMFREAGAASSLYFSSFSDEYAHHYTNLSEEHLGDPRIKDIDVLTSIDMSGLKSIEWEADFSVPKTMASLFSNFKDESSAGVLARVDFSDNESAAEMLHEWEATGKIWFAEPNEISKLSVDGLGQLAKDYANKQYWHKSIQIPEAFAKIAAGLPGAITEADIYNDPPVIAVLDSGVDYEHPQLKDNIWVNNQVGAAGCTDDIHGCNTTKPLKGSLGNGDVWPVLADGPGKECDASNMSQSERKCDHGTHVAGIIAAKPSSSSVVGGVCPMCRIMILRVAEVEGDSTSGDPQIQDDSQIRAFKYLTRFRKSGGSAVRIVNASFGKYSRSRSLAILVDVLKRVGSGTLVIAAASNEDSMIRSYPAALSNAIAVASVGLQSPNDSMRKSSFSNFGPWVDIAAPGYINSTVSGGNLRDMAGTSMASPVVAGAAGLLLAAYPSLNFNQLRERILKTASASKLYGSDTEGGLVNSQYYYPKLAGEEARRPLLGGGLVDVNAILENKGNFATGQPVERVTPGCGVIGGAGSSASPIVSLLLLLLPVLFWRLHRRFI